MTLKKILLSIFLLFATGFGYSQSFNVEGLTKAKLFNISGGVSANAIMYSGNAAREPFSYSLNGNININVAGLYNLPFSFSYSTQKFGYTKPEAIKTFSISPTYKWITAHIGDANMTFSPYTLNGHLFTGFGVDLTPPGKFKVSAMYGRLLKSSEYDLNFPAVVPTYERYGYGFKTNYAFEKVNLVIIFFKAGDVVNSLHNPVPFELGLTPKENVAMSFETGFKLFQKLQITTEYANSSMTENSSIAASTKGKGMASLFLNPNETTTSQNAVKVQLAYPAGKGTLGMGYERVDPNYRTLGSYYFNNDLENITVNATQSVYKDKVSLTLSLGLQRDNLEKQKNNQSKKIVSAITTDYKVNPKLNLNLNYSNFQSFTNSRNQFDDINQTPGLIHADTLNFRQVNQNWGLTASYLIKTNKQLKKSISANFSMQESVNQQQGKTLPGGETTFYNNSISYVQGYPTKNLNFTGTINNTINQTEEGNSMIFGPTLGVTKLFLDRKLSTSFSSGYNTGYSNGDKQNEVVNLRLAGSYVYLEKHNFNLGIMSLFGKSKTKNNNDLTATLTYTYSFDKIKIKINKREKNQLSDNIIKINSKNYKLEDTRQQLTKQFKALHQELQPLTVAEKIKLDELLNLTMLAPDDSSFKEKAQNYIEEYDIADKVVKKYNKLIIDAIRRVTQEITAQDESFETAFSIAISQVNTHKLSGKKTTYIKDKQTHNSYLKLVERSDIAKQKLQAHRYMLNEFMTLSQTKIKEVNQNENLFQFNKQEIEIAYKMIADKKADAELISHIEQNLIQFYHELALKNAMNDEIKFKYIIKR